jgi:light-regulated signal transduction histidine kinase (bacteriophytochrome)
VAVLHDLDYSIATTGSTVTIDPLLPVQGNEKQLLRVFQNLLANAIKYRSAAPAEIYISAECRGDDWVIKVKDNSIGIDPIHHKDVFGLLRRLHGPEISGAGLGLAICKKIVETLGGSIWVESKLGAGAVRGSSDPPLFTLHHLHLPSLSGGVRAAFSPITGST